MKIYNDENYFKTSDLALATTLSLHFPIISIDRFNPRKVLFVFSRLPELDQFVDKFWLNQISVEPQIFANQIKNLKTRIYSSD